MEKAEEIVEELETGNCSLDEAVELERLKDLAVVPRPDPDVLQQADVPEWCKPRHIRAAWALSCGVTREEAAKFADVSERTIYTWLGETDTSEEFQRLIRRLAFHNGIATQGGQLLEVKKLYHEATGKGLDVSLRKHDAVDLMRYARELAGFGTSDLPQHPILQYIQNILFDGPTTVRLEAGEISVMPDGEVVDGEARVINDADTEPVDVDSGGQPDISHAIPEEPVEAVSDWEPMPREAYPAAFAEDPNNLWVMVMPLRDDEVTVSGAGISFTVEFREGQRMGTLTTFAENARNRGIVGPY